MTNTVLLSTGMQYLIEKLGEVEAERFVALLISEPFDYTNWQRNLFADMNVDEISREAMKHCESN